ncbi:MAG: hypothetical protein HKN72_15230 [Gemmatimonadetes bacterium]|nr:hypothetical protein [Gemmatimonadota bacterium]NNF14579.1 hypothetical protein [Gemmatimonadota bacterium]NNL30816.1 hypothetical protein [Gemmatimonadota bacterium]
MNRIGTGDAMMGLAVVTLLLAAILPTLRARAFDRVIESAVADVDALRLAAIRSSSATGAWPAAAAPGIVPLGAAAAFPGDSALARDGYTLEWRLWERVEEVPAPPRPETPPVLDADEEPPVGGLVSTDAPPDSALAEVIEVVHQEGAIVVHSSRQLLLVALLRHFGSDVSFVADTMWTLLVSGEPVG